VHSVPLPAGFRQCRDRTATATHSHETTGSFQSHTHVPTEDHIDCDIVLAVRSSIHEGLYTQITCKQFSAIRHVLCSHTGTYTHFRD